MTEKQNGQSNITIRSESLLLTRPKLTLLNKNMFGITPEQAERTVGFKLFPEALEGRLRPETILTQSLDRLLRPKSKALATLKEAYKDTVLDILQMSQADLEALLDPKTAFSLKKTLSSYLDHFVISGHARLLALFLGDKPTIIPPDREDDLIQAVEIHLMYLGEREYRIITERFGLVDGIPKKKAEIGGIENITSEKVYEIEKKTMRKLHHLAFTRKTGITDYRIFPENSLGRAAGAFFWRDLPRGLEKMFVREVLSEVAFGKLVQEGLAHLDFGSLLLADLDQVWITEAFLNEIGQLVENYIPQKEAEQPSFPIQGKIYTADHDLTSAKPPERKPRRRVITSQNEIIKAIRQAQSEGIKDEQIAAWLKKNNISLTGKGSDHLIVKALIEYVINHPELKS